MNGILIVDKPQGCTSHDIVDLVRDRFGLKKVGHAGTLDPMATGVLVMLIGSATKLSNTFIADDKEYLGTLTLGATSDTGDAWGKVTPNLRSVDLGRDALEAAFAAFTGDISQRPPMYAAVKVNGSKLYELARRGLTVEVPARPVVIKALAITAVELPRVSFTVTCSKGTYVRQLAADIGDRLGCGAHLSALTRTRSGRFLVTEAIGVGELRSMTADDLERRLIRP